MSSPSKTSLGPIPLIDGIRIEVSSIRGGGWITTFSRGDETIAEDHADAPPWISPAGSERLSIKLHGVDETIDRAAIEAALREVFETIRSSPDAPALAHTVIAPLAITVEDIDGVTVEEATKILDAGRALEVMKTTFHREHEGDDLAAECLALVTACQSAINTDGLHVALSGEKGDGKTHTAESWLKQIPDTHKLAGSFSDKALFYMDFNQPLVIYIDDRALSEDLSATVKSATSHYQERTQHFTVSKDRSGAVMSLPQRCAFIFTKVDDVGDDQLLDRCLSVWVDSSLEHRDRVTNRTLARAAMPRGAALDDGRALEMCRALWTMIKGREYFVRIPFAERIVFEGLAFRNQGAFLDMIRCYAVLNFPCRGPTTGDDGITEIEATEEDFTQAERLFSRLSSDSGDLISKLTPVEAAVVEHLKRHETDSFHIKDVQEWLGCTSQRAHAILGGRNVRGVTYGGLLDKCPAISVKKASVSYEETGGVRRTTNRNLYDVDRNMLRSWARGHSIYLRPPGGENTHRTPTEKPRCGCSENGTEHRDTTNQTLYINNNFNNNHKGEDEKCECGECAPSSSLSYVPTSAVAVKSETHHKPPEFKPAPSKHPDCYNHGVGDSAVVAGVRGCSRADFHKLPRPDNGRACDHCGKRLAVYRENLDAAKNKHRGTLNLCEKCYAALPSESNQERLTSPSVEGFHKHASDGVVCSACGRLCAVAGGAFSDGRTILCGECLTRATRQDLQVKGTI